MVTKINSNAVAVKPVSHLCKFFFVKMAFTKSENQASIFLVSIISKYLIRYFRWLEIALGFLNFIVFILYSTSRSTQGFGNRLRTRDWLLSHNTIWFLYKIPHFSIWINFMVLETNRNAQDWRSFVKFCEIRCINNFLGNHWVVKRTHAAVTSPLTITETNAVKIT